MKDENDIDTDDDDDDDRGTADDDAEAAPAQVLSADDSTALDETEIPDGTEAPDDRRALDDEEVPDGVDAPDGARGLWEGDSGTLAFDTRRVLVQLLTGPSLDAQRQRLLWPVLLRDEATVRSHLADLFLELLIDPDLGVAFVRQVETDELDIPVLLRRQQLTFIDSVVLLHLRQLLIRAQSAGERAVVSTAEVVDAAGVYARSDSTDHAGFARRVASSVEKLKKASLLRKLRGSEERFEIAPTLKLLFSAERVEALLREYLALGGGRADDREDTAPEEGPERAGVGADARTQAIVATHGARSAAGDDIP